MEIIKPSIEILDESQFTNALSLLEKIGRVCYKSEDKITPESAKPFINGIIKRGHTAVIEHVVFSVKITCDRGVSHELVRHRIANFAQESTRYVRYNSGKETNSMKFIKPTFWNEGQENFEIWKNSCIRAEQDYNDLLARGAIPQEARSVLPNSLKTEICMTLNPRSWRNFFQLRTSKAAHPDMQYIANTLLKMFKERVSVLFDDIEPDFPDRLIENL